MTGYKYGTFQYQCIFAVHKVHEEPYTFIVIPIISTNVLNESIHNDILISYSNILYTKDLIDVGM